jgi:hypothetical protein
VESDRFLPGCNWDERLRGSSVTWNSGILIQVWISRMLKWFIRNWALKRWSWRIDDWRSTMWLFLKEKSGITVHFSSFIGNSVAALFMGIHTSAGRFVHGVQKTEFYSWGNFNAKTVE